MEAVRTRRVGPTGGQERHEFLDVLRGLSLAGIVLANMISLSLYLYLSESERASLSTASSDRVFDFLELVLIESKFYTIFSVLFGIGFSILIKRAESKGIVFRPFFVRRALFLYLIGVAHGVLFWHNDILQSYAVCGVLLLPFVRASNRTILTAAAVALTMPLVFSLWEVVPPGTFLGPRQLLFERFGFTSETRVAIWSAGSLRDIVLLNASSWFGQFDFVITSGMIFKIYGCFLLGLYVGRNELHQRFSQFAVLLRRIGILGVAIGLPLNVLYASTYESESHSHAVVSTIAILPLSAGYVSLLAWLWTGALNGLLVRTFAPVGRMALTNYVGQSAIAMLIFRGVGLGLGGTMGPTLYLPLGIAIYLAQLAVSRAWLARFDYGPLEWFWRMLTYGAVIPLRKPQSLPAPEIRYLILQRGGTMAVFYIGTYDIVDPEEFKKYPPLVLALLPKYGGEVLASDTQAFLVEGTARTMNAIIRFPSKDAALGLYNDPDYQEAKRIRQASTKNISMVLAQEI